MKTSLPFFLLFLLLSVSCIGQITTPVIRANFGVDGDLRANYYNNFVQSGNDDWFLQPGTNGTGQFVIDTTGAAAIVSRYATDMASRRLPFYRGMRFPGYTVVNNRMLLDAVMIRDYHGDDSTVFASGSNKNGDSPNDWQCPVSQGVPDKNDILDMMVHVRRAGPNKTDSLWMFGGMSLDNTTGNRYFDFEMYQTDIYYDRGTRRFYGYGPDAGHTSWQFDASGRITVPGDIIFSAEYQSSSLSNIEARIWVHRSALSIIPASFDWAGQFDGAASGAEYGYASIRPKNGGTYYTGLQCGNGTWAGPFSVVLQDESVITNYSARQFVEFSVNLTKLGLDPVTLLGSNTCGMPFRRVLVKTRSSASFTAELKDFVGPFDFFLAPRVQVQTATPTICPKTSVAEIRVTNPVATSVYEWTTPNGNIISSSSGTTIYVDQPGTYIVTQYLQRDCAPYATDTIEINRFSFCQVLASNSFINFRGATTGASLQLNWQVQDNEQVRFFEIQKSSDGKNFQTVGQVNAQSFSLYSFETLQSDQSFYRVQLINADNSRVYSSVYKAGSFAEQQEGLTIYPNPAKGSAHLQLYSSQVVEGKMAVFNAAGNQVFSKLTQLQKGYNHLTMDKLDRFPRGLYLVVVELGTYILRQKFVLAD